MTQNSYSSFKNKNITYFKGINTFLCTVKIRVVFFFLTVYSESRPLVYNHLLTKSLFLGHSLLSSDLICSLPIILGQMHKSIQALKYLQWWMELDI